MILFRRLIPAFLLLALVACNGPLFPKHYEDDRAALLQSLKHIEVAGQILQTPELNEQVVEKALLEMDDGLRQAWQVSDGFLSWVDPTLRLSYHNWLVEGVENYRLGVTAADPEQQQEALKKLLQWQQFWSRNRESLLKRMQIETAS